MSSEINSSIHRKCCLGQEWDKSLDSSAGQTNPSVWRALKALQPGAIVTLDPTVFYEYAGDYEIMQKTFNPMQIEVEDSTSGNFLQGATRSGAMNNGTDQNSGVLQLVLRTFNPSSTIFTDVSPAPNASFATVPGQLPYGGGGGSSSGGGVGGGGGGGGSAATLTVSTDSSGVVTVTWTALSVTLTSGVVLNYTAGSATNVSDLFATLGAIQAGSACFLFVEDIGATGGSGKVFVGSVALTPGGNLPPEPPPNLVVTLLNFIAPVQAASGQPPNVNQLPDSVTLEVFTTLQQLVSNRRSMKNCRSRLERAPLQRNSCIHSSEAAAATGWARSICGQAIAACGRCLADALDDDRLQHDRLLGLS